MRDGRRREKAQKRSGVRTESLSFVTSHHPVGLGRRRVLPRQGAVVLPKELLRVDQLREGNPAVMLGAISSPSYVVPELPILARSFVS